MVPQAPISLLNVPICSLDILDCAIAEAHIEQGSNVTYISDPFNRQSPILLLASSMAKISACAIADFKVSFKLCDLAIISPSFTITAPIGTSPLE